MTSSGQSYICCVVQTLLVSDNEFLKSSDTKEKIYKAYNWT